MSNKYSVFLDNPHAHTFTVKLEISQPNPAGQTLSLPAWIPGSYMIRDFAKNIHNLRATAQGTILNYTKTDKDTWQLEPTDAAIEIEYEVYAWDHSVRSAHFDMTHAFFNGTSLFLCVTGQQHDTIELEIIKPAKASYSDWHVTTSLKSSNIDNKGFGTYAAENYDDLIDHPFEIGSHTEFTFNVQGVPHKMAFTGICEYDSKRLEADMTRICETHCAMFGEIPKIEQYIFMTMVTGNSYGGLEHRSSTSLMCSRSNLPLPGHPEEPEEKYRTYLALCSHEYFHTWNVKRIKPEGFLPYDLSKETYTRQLWAFEGITSYYDELALLRSGVISVNSYLELLAQTITRVIRGKGRLIQSVADSSFDAWTKFYKQDESAPNCIVSYYTKGTLIALCLDLVIRKHTDNKKSLDDVMRRLWQNYGKPMIGVPEGQIEQVASEIAGHSLDEFFQQYLYTTTELPLNELLGEFGIEYHLYPTVDVEDKGGKKPASEKVNVSFGARMTDEPGGIRINLVYKNDSAEMSGLSANDLIIAVNQLKVNKSGLTEVLSQKQPGDELLIHAFRRDELYTFKIILQQPELTSCYLTVAENLDEATQNKQASWLHIDNDKIKPLFPL